MIIPRTGLKDFFKTGDTPTEDQYSDLIDSSFIKNEDADIQLGGSYLMVTGSGTLTLGSGAIILNNTCMQVGSGINNVIESIGVGGSIRLSNNAPDVIRDGDIFVMGNRYRQLSSEKQLFMKSAGKIWTLDSNYGWMDGYYAYSGVGFESSELNTVFYFNGKTNGNPSFMPKEHTTIKLIINSDKNHWIVQNPLGTSYNYSSSGYTPPSGTGWKVGTTGTSPSNGSFSSLNDNDCILSSKLLTLSRMSGEDVQFEVFNQGFVKITPRLYIGEYGTAFMRYEEGNFYAAPISFINESALSAYTNGSGLLGSSNVSNPSDALYQNNNSFDVFSASIS